MLVTPTGAAIVTTLAKFERPAMVVTGVGYGAGSREIEDRPNLLRLWLGEESPERPGKMVLIETNIDDMSPELLGYAQERLFAEGAVDVWFTSIQMKKNRPGVLLTVLCAETDADKFSEMILRETSAFGVRRTIAERRKLKRELKRVKTQFGNVTVKVGTLNGEIVQAAPEYESCKKLAVQKRVPVKKVYEAAQQARIYDNIMDFPDQFETKLGERGVTLSGGQRQRTSLARGMIKDAPILILDDSVSAVDAITETEIVNNIAKLRNGRKTIIIADRVSALKHADHIVVLDQGSIIQQGKHEELLRKDGLYRRLYELQEEGTRT